MIKDDIIVAIAEIVGRVIFAILLFLVMAIVYFLVKGVIWLANGAVGS